MTKPNKPTREKPTTTQTTDPMLRQSLLRHLQTLKIQLSEEELDEIVRQSTRQNHTAWQLLERFLAVPANGARERAITIRFDGKSYRQHRAEQMRSSASNRAKPST